MTLFAELTECLDSITSVSSRNAKIDLIANFLQKLTEEEVSVAALFIAGRVFSENDSRKLNTSWKGIFSALMQITGATQSDLSSYYEGDAGEAVASLLASDKFSRQAILFSEPLTILSVKRSLEQIAETTGKGSKKVKEGFITQLFQEAGPREARYIVALILNDMRTGVSDGLLIDGVAKSFNIEPAIVRRAWSFTGNIGEVASIAVVSGVRGLESVGVELFRPVKPMLATSISAMDELDSEIGLMALELKFDGARVQIHKKGTKVNLYSRRLEDVTESLPEVVNLVVNHIAADNVILDGEIVAIDQDGRPYPFQVVMRRFGRTQDVEEAQKDVQLHLFLFDILKLNDEDLVDCAYSVRREKLVSIVPIEYQTETLVSVDAKSAEEYFERSKQLGHEGIMLKRLDSKYIPGVRGKHWFKVKHTLDTLDLVIIAAEWGYGRRNKWLSDYHLAVRDEETGEYWMVGKTFKGLTDQEFSEMTQALLELETGRERGIVFVSPKIVVEVLASEIQESPTYESGMALRFARIIEIREDKTSGDVTTLAQLRGIFESQFEYKARK